MGDRLLHKTSPVEISCHRDSDIRTQTNNVLYENPLTTAKLERDSELVTTESLKDVSNYVKDTAKVNITIQFCKEKLLQSPQNCL